MSNDDDKQSNYRLMNLLCCTNMARLSGQYSNNLNIRYIHYIPLPYFLFPLCRYIFFATLFFIFLLYFLNLFLSIQIHVFNASIFYFFSLSYMRSIFFIFIPYVFFVPSGIFYFLSNQYATRDHMTTLHFLGLPGVPVQGRIPIVFISIHGVVTQFVNVSFLCVLVHEDTTHFFHSAFWRSAIWRKSY